MTPRQKEILEHALGLNYRKKSYRNRFATAPDCDHWNDVQALVGAGLMREGRTLPGGLIYFYVTPAGLDALDA